jgi:hypothetical protein
MSSPATDETEAGATGSAVTSAAPAAGHDAALAAYLLVEPFLGGKVVLDIGPRPAGAEARLRRAGARQVLACDDPGPELELSRGAADVVLCVSRLAGPGSDVERHRWLGEIRRLLRPDGFCLLRFPVEAFAGEGDRSAAVGELVRHHFPVFDVVAEAPLHGVSYIAPATDEVAVNEQLTSIAGPPSHLVVLGAEGARRPAPWSLPESLLVPLGEAAGAGRGPAAGDLAALRAELEAMAARHEGVCQERDSLRERMMALQEGAERDEQTQSALRRDAERHLGQLSEELAHRELTGLERERLERRAASAERALEAHIAQLAQRTAQLVALERELARLRASAPAGRSAG